MREIKFRAWDKKYKTMHQFEDMLNARSGCIKETLDHKQFIVLPKHENIILMQYTGLKDKNRTEIYEGDILGLINVDGDHIQVVCEYGIARRKVKGSRITEVDIPCFYFKLSNGHKSFPIVRNYAKKHDLEIMEVIGNLYENPELLTAQTI